MDPKTWLHSLIAAAIGGGSSALLAAVAMPEAFNLTHDGLTHLGKLALIGALVPVLTLLKQSPLPGDKTVSTTETFTPPNKMTTVEQTTNNPAKP